MFVFKMLCSRCYSWYKHSCLSIDVAKFTTLSKVPIGRRRKFCYQLQKLAVCRPGALCGFRKGYLPRNTCKPSNTFPDTNYNADQLEIGKLQWSAKALLKNSLLNLSQKYVVVVIKTYRER